MKILITLTYQEMAAVNASLNQILIFVQGIYLKESV